MTSPDEPGGQPSPPPPPPPPMPPMTGVPMSSPTQSGAMPITVNEERTWAMLAHLSGLLISAIGPLIILLVFGPRSEFDRDQATEALNFQLTLLIASVVSGVLVLVLVGIVLLPLVIIAGIVFMIIGAVQSYGGQRYRYPITIRMVK